MAEKPKTASDYLREAQRNAAPRVAAPRAPISDSSLGKFEGQGTGVPQSPVNWLMDILSRGIFGVNNIVNSSAERQVSAQKKFASGDFLGGAGDIAANAAQHLLPVDFLTGLTTTDKSRQRYGSQTIEHVTDTFGSLDPNYIDETDNVNPWVKGIAGFAADFVLDPVNLIPGAAFAKIGRGIKAGAKGLGGGVRAVKDTRAAKVAEKAADEAGEATVPTTETVSEGLLQKLSDDTASEAKAMRDASGLAPSPLTPEEALAKSQFDVDAALSTEKAQKIRGRLDSFKAHTVKIAPDTAATTAKALNEVPVAVSAPFKQFRQWVDEVEDLVVDLPVGQQPKLALPGGKSISMIEALGAASRADRNAAAALRAWYSDSYAKSFSAGREAGHGVDALGKPIQAQKADVTHANAISEVEQEAAEAARHYERLQSDPAYQREVMEDALSLHSTNARPGEPIPTLEGLVSQAGVEAEVAATKLSATTGKTTSATKEILSARQVFQRQLVEDGEVLESIFGKPLLAVLKRNAREETKDSRFNQVVEELKGILDRTINVHSVKNLEAASERMLRELGVTVEGLPKIAVKPQAVPNEVPVAQKIEEVLARLNTGGDVEMERAVKKGLASFIEKDILKVRDEMIYTHESLSGVKMTGPSGAAEVVGNIPNEINQFKQFNMLSPVIEHFAALAAKAGPNGKSLMGAQRARFMRENVMKSWRAIENVLDERGLPIVLGLNKESRIPLSGSQVIDILDEIDPKLVDLVMWNRGTSVSMTNLMDAVYVATKQVAASPEMLKMAVKAQIVQDVTAWSKKTIPNPIVEGIGTASYRYGASRLAGRDLVDELSNAVLRAAPRFRVVANDNAVSITSRGIAESKLLIDNALTSISEDFANGSLEDFLRSVDGAVPRLVKHGEEMGATDLGKGVGAVTTDSMIPTIDKILADGTIKTEAAVSKAVGEGLSGVGKGGKTATSVIEDAQRAAIPTQQKMADDLGAEGVAASRNSPLDSTIDLGVREAETLDWINANFFNRTFFRINRSSRMRLMHEKVVGNENLWRDIVGRTAVKLNSISASLGREGFVDAFRAVQTGSKPVNPEVLKHFDEIEEITEKLFGRAGARASWMNNAFFNKAQNIEHVNSAISRYFPNSDKYLFNVDDAVKAAKTNGTNVMDELAGQWRTWKIDNPADFLNGMNTALAKINVDQSVALQFQNIAASKAMGSTSLGRVPKPGYSRISNDGGRSIMAKYLPDDVYYPDEALEMLQSVDVLMRQSLDLSGDFGKWVKTVYKPVQDMWKTGMTVVNLTHHIRNGISDASLTLVAEGWTSLDVYRRALSTMGSRNNYTDWDAIKALQGIGEVPNSGKLISSTAFGDVTADGLYSALSSRGNLPSFRVLEDLEDGVRETAGALASGWRKFGHTKTMKVVGGVTENRDHFFRVAHAIKILDNPKYAEEAAKRVGPNASKEAKLEALLDIASERVRKWHPDGSDLTSTEHGLKLIIPFYSWQRKTIPLIAEALLTNPARIMAFPKASFNLAVAMGVNPDSLAEPFPQDQMFPSYLTKQMQGPVFEVNGKYYGINPGFAGNDILNAYASGEPLREILDSVSPLIRAPWELATGGTAHHGARINDTSDYIDQQLPGISPLSRITGNSFTGSLVSLLKGEGFDPQYQIARGNKEAGENTLRSAANWLLGLGITPMSQPNQINYAEIEKRNREGGRTDGF